MAIVTGTIETLKRLKETLHKKGITRFSSIGEIRTFLENYESEKNDISNIVKITLDNEIDSLIQGNKYAINMSDESLFFKIFYFLKIKIQSRKIESLKRNYSNVLQHRCSEACERLEFTKNTVESLQTQVAGVIGENAVVNELQKLSDNFYVINDFSRKFNPPIYNKKQKDRIFTVQIDHLLVCPSGVYVIETKNWSAQSVENQDLRSPVEQIKRTSFALFVLLNSRKNSGLARHHWGSKKIPIRNIIVMTNKAPKAEFNHVKVLALDNLNSYIQYFEETFSKFEVENIFNYLNK